VPNNQSANIGPAPWPVTYGPSTRRLIDFADAPTRSPSTPWESGVPFDKHYGDQAETYIEGGYEQAHFSDEEVTANTRGTLKLCQRADQLHRRRKVEPELLRRHPRRRLNTLRMSIALHTTPGVPQHLRPTVALVTAGVEMDVLGLDYTAFTDGQRDAVVHAHPRGEGFKECIICAFADGLRHRPQTTFGNVKTDVLVDQEPGFKPMNFVEVIRQSPWTA
jgi:hypothetical protein